MTVALKGWNAFSTREDLAAALAKRVADVLRKAISARGTGFLAVSGGSTPAKFFAALSRQELDWNKVTVTLIDERFVPETSPRSNAALVQANLLVNNAARADFIGLYSEAADIEEGVERANALLEDAPFPLDAAILGMGPDGHTASFFPDAETLPQLLDPASDHTVMPVIAESAGEPRLTLSLARIVASGFLALHIEGREKRDVLDAAIEEGRPLPIRAVFEHAPGTVQVYWAP